MNIRNILSFFLIAAACMPVAAHDFDTHFADSTLRIDYVFSGKAGSPAISVDGAEITKGWYGRRNNLDNVPFQGNGQIIVTDIENGDTLYINAFSSLFQEWLVTPEADAHPQSMENVFMVPLPRKEANVTVTLYNNMREPMVSLTHKVDPDDILIRRPDTGNPVPYRYIHKSGSPKDKIDVAILAEGYTPEEMDSFYSHASTAVQSILSHEPFKSHADDFNFVAVASPSKESGVSVPKNGQWKDTAFSSHYSTFYSDRYLTTTSVKSIHNALRGIPFEHIIILANEEEYGGGGIFNFYTLTTARHKDFWPVVTHEFGHSFGALADEYFYPDDMMDQTYPDGVEPWEPNLTTLVDFDSKWADMIPEGTAVPTPPNNNMSNSTVGLFEGGGYRMTGIYRPVDMACRMRFNHAEAFCPVCQRAIITLIEFYTDSNN